MAQQHRNLARRLLSPRQVPPVGGGQPGRGPGGPGGGGPAPSSASAQPTASDDDPFTDPGNNPVFTKASSTTAAPSSPPPAQATKPTTSSQGPPSTTSAQSQPTTAPSTSSISSSSSSLSSSTPSALTVTTPLNTFTVPAHVATSSFATLPLTTPDSIFPTESATPTDGPSPTSGVKVGTVVGAIAGTLVGIGILGLVVSFFLRRLRKRNHRDTIIGEDFRPTFDTGDEVLEPPSMTQRHHSITPSVVSGPGMAGHGAFQNAAGYATTVTAAAAGGALHERPRYTYGQPQAGGEDDASEIAHGVYSSQPQAQMPYNPEAYGSYANYEADANNAGYQDATRQYQAQPGYDGQYAQYNNSYIVADPGASATPGAAPVAGSPVAGAHPIARDPASMTGNRGPNTRSIVQDDDVYGGI